MNGFFASVVLASVLFAALAGRLEPLTRSLFDSVRESVEIALGLVGAIAFFLGLMRLATDSGVARAIARASAPLLRRLFPDVPPEHPAMTAIVLNLASNLLGLGNAATPFGVRAMIELDRLNRTKGVATDAMVTFLALNTAGFAILPTGILSLRAAAGSKDPAGILLPAWVGSGVATLVGVVTALLLARVRFFRIERGREPVPDVSLEPNTSSPDADTPQLPSPPGRTSRFAALAAGCYASALAGAIVLYVARSLGTEPAIAVLREIVSYGALPALVAGVVLLGWARGVRVYASLVEGAKEGFEVALRILPYLVAVFAAVGMFRGSGAFEALSRALGPWTEVLGLPVEALPVALLRPLSGSGAYGLAAEVLRARGPDSFVGYLVSVIQASTETTFYVLAVYLGAAGVRRGRHAVFACLAGDVAGIAAGVLAANLLFVPRA
jgi:spore maturation protein SpmA